MKIDGSISYAAGLDAGNRSMRAGGRSVWNADDYDAAAAVATRLLVLAMHPSAGGLPVTGRAEEAQQTDTE